MYENESKYRITSDVALWDDFRAGDEKAFNRIYRIYVQQLYKYGSKFSKDEAFVLDCIQELFIDIFTHRNNLGETNNIKLYLFISLKRKILRSLYKDNLIQSFPDDKLPFLSTYSSENEITDIETDPGKINELKKALKTLSPRQKEAIYLRFSCKLQYEEICQIMKLNNQSVRNLVHRAIEELRKILISIFFFTLLH